MQNLLSEISQHEGIYIKSSWKKKRPPKTSRENLWPGSKCRQLSHFIIITRVTDRLIENETKVENLETKREIFVDILTF